jgi:hypothetical protein
VIETAGHLFYECDAAALLWEALGITHDGADVSNPWGCSHPPPHLANGLSNDVLLVVMWRIWNSRNDVIFRSEYTDTQSTLRAFVRDLDLWSFRYRSLVLKLCISQWRAHVSDAVSRQPTASP